MAMICGQNAREARWHAIQMKSILAFRPEGTRRNLTRAAAARNSSVGMPRDRRLPGLLRPAVAEPREENVRIAVIVAGDTVPNEARDPLFGESHGKGERYQRRDRRGAPGIAFARVLPINIDIGAGAEAEADPFVKEAVDGPRLRGDAAAPDDFRIALVYQRRGAVNMAGQAAAVLDGAGERLLAEQRVHDALAAENGDLVFGDIGFLVQRVAELPGRRCLLATEPNPHAHRRRGHRDVMRRIDAIHHEPVIGAVGKIARRGNAVDRGRAMHVGRIAAGQGLRVVKVIDAGAERNRELVLKHRQVAPQLRGIAVAVMAGQVTFVDIGKRSGEIPVEVLPVVDLPGAAEFAEVFLRRKAAEQRQLLRSEVKAGAQQRERGQFPNEEGRFYGMGVAIDLVDCSSRCESTLTKMLDVFPVPDAIAGRLETGMRRQVDRRSFFALTPNSLRLARGVSGEPALPASPVRS